MLIKSAVLTQASGSLAGSVFSHNKGGLYVRARSIPTNPNSAAQQLVRGKMQELATAWGDVLTAAQRSSWADYAANVPVTNRLGDSILLSGQQHYVRSNVPRLIAGLPRVDSGPTVFNQGSFTDPTMTVAGGGADLSVTFTETDAWVDEDDAGMIIQSSRGVSETINFFKGPFRFADSIDGDGTTAPTSPAAITTPFTFASGQKVFARVLVSRADGRLATPSIIDAIAS